MTVDQAIKLYAENIHLVIQSLVTALLLLILFMGWRAFFSKPARNENAHGGGSDTFDNERATSENALPDKAFQAHMEALQKQLAEIKNDMKFRPETSVSGAPAGERKSVSLESSKSQKSPKAAASVNPGSADASEHTKALLSRVAELEERLAEYEIIEDDIADLSFYKSEVTRLQALIDGPGGARVSAPAISQQEGSDLASDSDLAGVSKNTEDSSSSSESEASSEQTPPPPPSPPFAPAPELQVEEESEAVLEEDLMAEFNTAIEAEEGIEPGSAIGGAGRVSDSSLALTIEGELDIEKMVSEADEIVSSSSVDEGDSDINALESEIDPDKLAEEALAMAAGGADSLMDEFEQFTKDGGKNEESN